MNPKLQSLIEEARRRPMTPEELVVQQISFAFGNVSYEDATVTRETVARYSAVLNEADEPETAVADS